MTLNVLLVTGGHPFAAGPFAEVFESINEISVTRVAHPEAMEYFDPARCAPFDVVVLYDMPGLRFTHAEPPAELIEPPAWYTDGFMRLLEAGKGFVALHHAIAGWPAWPAYADFIGGRFHYQPGELRGVRYPDSGYLLDVVHEVEVIEPDHPICSGVPTRFTLTDELYLAPVFEEDVVPLMRTSADMTDTRRFFSAAEAISGRRDSNDGWTHPTGSNVVCWVKNARRSPLAYIQFGDGPAAYSDGNYRKILANAIKWAASESAQAWAAERYVTSAAGHERGPDGPVH